jgi:hypothetical protein
MRIPGFDAEASVYRTSNTYRGAYAILADNVAANKHDRNIGTPLPPTLCSEIQPVNLFADFADEFLMSAIATTPARSNAIPAQMSDCDRYFACEPFCRCAFLFHPGERQDCIDICNSQCKTHGLDPCVVPAPRPGAPPVLRCKCGSRGKCCKLGDVCCGRPVVGNDSAFCCPKEQCCITHHPATDVDLTVSCCAPNEKCTMFDGCCPDPERRACGPYCCPEGKVCSDDGKTCVCPTGQVPCGSSCCPRHKYCVDGQCVDCQPGGCPGTSTCCVGEGMAAPFRWCCPPPARHPINKVCCPRGINVCCPADRPFCLECEVPDGSGNYRYNCCPSTDNVCCPGTGTGCCSP